VRHPRRIIILALFAAVIVAAWRGVGPGYAHRLACCPQPTPPRPRRPDAAAREPAGAGDAHRPDHPGPDGGARGDALTPPDADHAGAAEPRCRSPESGWLLGAG
jgi:hypothetical protein